MPKGVNWLSFLNDHGVKESGIRKGLWIKVPCLFCDSSTGVDYGAINKNSGAYHCWKCGSHKWQEYVSYLTGTVEEDCWKELQPYKDDYVPYEPVKYTDRKEQVAIKINRIKAVGSILQCPGEDILSNRVKKYLRNRGFNTKYLVKKYGIKDGGIVGPYAYRVMIPFYLDSKVVTFQGRHISPNEKIRYMACSDEESLLNVKDMVYNLDNCKKKKAIVVEGVFDCWKIGNDCCAICGISVKDSQIRLLASRFEELFFLFDPEKKAQDMAAICCQKLKILGVKTHIINVSGTDASDPGAFSEQEVIKLKSAVFQKEYKRLPQFRRCKV